MTVNPFLYEVVSYINVFGMGVGNRIVSESNTPLIISIDDCSSGQRGVQCYAPVSISVSWLEGTHMLPSCYTSLLFLDYLFLFPLLSTGYCALQ